MIAHSTGRTFLPDEVIGQKNVEKLKRLSPGFSLQCPALFPSIELISLPNTAVVIMQRSISDINKSIRRIAWDGSQEEIERYENRLVTSTWLDCVKLWGSPKEAITDYKYWYWWEHQSHKMIMPAYLLRYNSLEGHPLWIPKKEREHFEPRQISREHRNCNSERIN